MSRRMEEISNPFHKELLSHHWWIKLDRLDVMEKEGTRLGCVIQGIDLEVSQKDLEKLADKYGVGITTLIGG
ncbi:MAG: hypothetical protein JXR12_06535 [Neptunomonas phycophila]|uniref:hypothetical protein n=1 Tax=Neptunomonas phycophila TaxID=1572645 RepID=UPI003B8D7412